ncbi:MAG: secretin N-terminal domain-containing protein [Pseudomonadota bacterium]
MSSDLLNFSNWLRKLSVAAAAMMFAGCALVPAVDMSPGHVLADDEPEPVVPPVVAPPPAPVIERTPEPVYTIVVKEVPVVDLMFSLARDAELNLDLQADNSKKVTINAVERPLSEILDRIAEQAKLRFELYGDNLIVKDDTPFWKNYFVDYVNVTRDSEGEVGVATQIATSGGSVGEDSGGDQGDQAGNLSKTTVRNISKNDFWASLEMGLTAIVSSDTSTAASSNPAENDPDILLTMTGSFSAGNGPDGDR